MTLLKQLKYYARAILSVPGSQKYKELAKQYYIIGGFKRIYFYHIRKTGGTSLNYAFLSLGGEQGSEVYKRLNRSINYRTVSNDKSYVGWNKYLIEQGYYFYAFSHLPEHELTLPENTFTITCLRDPVKRVLSHYKMLLEYREYKPSHPLIKTEGRWLGNCFCDFVSNIPKEHLLRQIYMFSKIFDWREAFDRITNCSFFFFAEDYAQGVEELSSKLKIYINALHIRKTSIKHSITATDEERLRSLLHSEYILLEELQKYRLQCRAL